MTDLQVFPVRVARDTKSNKIKKSPAIPKGEDWKTYKASSAEIEKSKNIGVVIPSGVIVIDLDTDKGVTRDDVDLVLGCSLAWEQAELQNTPSGGQHYGFLCSEELRQGTDLLNCKGFDTRTSGKGWIASGEGYEDLTLLGLVDTLEERELPALPAKAAQQLSVNANSDDSSDLDVLLASQPLDGLTNDDMRAYLKRLGPEHYNNYDGWLHVGMGIYHQSEGKKWGFDMFVDWSKQSDSFDIDEIKAKWRNFRKGVTDTPRTFASIIKDAGGKSVLNDEKVASVKEQIETVQDKEGFNALLKEVAKMPLDQSAFMTISGLFSKQSKTLGLNFTKPEVKSLIKSERAAAKNKEYVDYCDEYVYLSHTDEYFNKESKAAIKVRAFDVVHGRDTPLTSEGEPQRASTYVNNRIQYVNYMMYAPQFPLTFSHQGLEYVNTYKPNVVADDGIKTNIVERFIQHVNHLLTDEREQQIFISFLAYNLQFPGAKIPWALILQGVQGDGKTFFYEVMKFVLGGNNCRSINVNELEEKFTKWAEGSCMVFIEELKLDNYRKYETLNKLKPYITNPTVSVRRMNVDSYEAINTTNYVALTNFKDALPIDENDRRYCVLFSQWQNAEKLKAWIDENPDYYPSLYNDMRERWQEIYDWLKAYEIPSWFMNANRAPDTLAKSRMMELSKSDSITHLEDAIERFKCEDINDHILNVTKLQKLVKNSLIESDDFEDFPKGGKLKHAVENKGFQYIGQYHNRQNVTSKQRIYCKDFHANWDELSEKISM